MFCLSCTSSCPLLSQLTLLTRVGWMASWDFPFDLRHRPLLDCAPALATADQDAAAGLHSAGLLTRCHGAAHWMARWHWAALLTWLHALLTKLARWHALLTKLAR